MNRDLYRLASRILEKCREFGAPLAGICEVAALKMEPSTRVVPHIPAGSYGSLASPLGLKPGEVRWPEGGQSVIVLAVPHPESEPELDWWFGQIDPPGNRLLKATSRRLKDWLGETCPEIKVSPITYHIEKGGIFLKEAARLAGLGCIGRNNLLVTPEYGSRVRLRALILDQPLPATGPSAFDPCPDCAAPCLKSCPNRAFERIVLTAEQTGEKHLPGRIGNYCRSNCSQVLLKNEAEAEPQLVPEISDLPVPVIKYCRNCELSCPYGSR